MKNNKTNKTAFVYLRVSTPAQLVEEQLKENLRYAAENNIEVVSRYGDYNKRHLAHKRQSFQQMLEDVATRKPDFILVQRLDRFGTKHQNELGHFLYVLEQHGVKLITTIDGADRSKTDLKTTLLNCIGAGTSQEEQTTKAERVLTGKRGRALAGEYIGTKYFPYATDLVCIGKDDNEKWRLVEESYDLRIKYFPDDDDDGGYRELERYTNEVISDPNGIMPDKLIRYRPQKDIGDKLYYSPSIRTERIETLKRIFELFDTGWTTYGIAEQLNKENIPPLFAPRWYSALVDGLLSNPVFVGRPTFNRTTQATFRTIKDGKIQEVDTDTKKGTKFSDKSKGEWIQPQEQVFDPIIEPSLFDRVQEKLDERKRATPKRQPRCETLWFGGLWVDEETGLKLAGDTRQKMLSPKSKEHCHKRLRFGQAEQLIERYLQETGQRLATIKEATESRNVLERLAQAEYMQELRIEYIIQEIQAYIGSKCKKGFNDVGGVQVILDYDDDGNPVITTNGDLLEVYITMLHDDSKQEHEKSHELRVERDRLMAEYIRTKDKSEVLADAIIRRINELTEAMGQLAVIPNFRDWLKEVERETDLLREQQEKVRQGLAQSEPIGKAKAIREVVDKIMVRWQERPTTDRRHKGGSRLEVASATFYPTNGQLHPKTILMGQKHPQGEMTTVETPLA